MGRHLKPLALSVSKGEQGRLFNSLGLGLFLTGKRAVAIVQVLSSTLIFE
jgi:hypothetical protein